MPSGSAASFLSTASAAARPPRGAPRPAAPARATPSASRPPAPSDPLASALHPLACLPDPLFPGLLGLQARLRPQGAGHLLLEPEPPEQRAHSPVGVALPEVLLHPLHGLADSTKGPLGNPSLQRRQLLLGQVRSSPLPSTVPMTRYLR